MGDDEHALEQVGRAHPPALWIGAWVLGLAAVVAVAVAGRVASGHDPTLIPEAVVSPSEAPVAVASPAVRDRLVVVVIGPFGVRASSPPRPRPTLGDDGLVGGTVFSSAPPTD